MKNLIFVLITALVFVLVTPAQTTTDNITVEPKLNGLHLYYSSLTVDSAETIWSQSLDLSQYDGFSYSTYPFGLGYDLATADSINISAFWYVSYDNSNWVLADTLFNAVVSATAAKTTFDMNNVKAPYNKIKIVNNTGASANTLKLGLYQPLKD